MKNWNEAIEGKIIYVEKEIEVYEDEGIIGKTKPYQKAFIDNVDHDAVTIIIENGKFEGYDFYFYFKDSTPEELLTEEEFKLIKITEVKVWKDLNKFIKIIDALKEKSEDILMVKNLIEKHLK